MPLKHLRLCRLCGQPPNATQWLDSWQAQRTVFLSQPLLPHPPRLLALILQYTGDRYQTVRKHQQVKALYARSQASDLVMTCSLLAYSEDLWTLLNTPASGAATVLNLCLLIRRWGHGDNAREGKEGLSLGIQNQEAVGLSRLAGCSRVERAIRGRYRLSGGDGLASE